METKFEDDLTWFDVSADGGSWVQRWLVQGLTGGQMSVKIGESICVWCIYGFVKEDGGVKYAGGACTGC